MIIIDNVIYIGINKKEMSILKIKDGEFQKNIYKDVTDIDNSKLNSIFENYPVITHDFYNTFKFFEEHLLFNDLLDSRELIGVLEPWQKEFDIDYLFNNLTNLNGELSKAEKNYYVVESALRRLWFSEEKKKNTLYKLLIDSYNLKNKWNWINYIDKPIFFDITCDFVNYKENNIKEEPCYEGKIDYSKYEGLLEDKEIWNAGGNFPYKYRKEQEEMSSRIRKNIEDEDKIFIEAPTGSGKSFAYLLITVLKAYINSYKHNRDDATFIISTDTKELQNQLITKDIPNIIHKLRLKDKVTYGAMKGKSNYICTEKLEKYSKLYTEAREALGEVVIRRLCAGGKHGDIETINHYLLKHFYLEDVLMNVACNNDECNLEKCHKACYLRNRYIKLQSENITVINHSLLASWPYAEKRQITHLIIDEAHNLMEKCYDFYSEEFESEEFIKSLQSLTKNEPTIYRELRNLNSSNGYRENIELEKLNDLQKQIEDSIKQLLYRGIELDLVDGEYNFKTEFYLCSDKLKSKMLDLKEYISKIKYNIYALYKVINTYFNNITLDGEEGKDDREYLIISNFVLKLKGAFDVIDGFLENTETYGRVLEVYKEYSGFKVVNIPLNIAQIFNEITLKDVKSVTYLSATMMVRNSFNKIKYFLGQKEAKEFVLPQIFNLKERTKIYNVTDIGKYYTKDFIKNTANFIFEISKITNGHILVLFTNNARRKAVEEELNIISEGSNIEIYTSKGAIGYLKDKKRKVVILGSKTFFEGIDIPGDGLTTVILDKLPNKSIDDPLLKAITIHQFKSYKEVNYPQLCIKVKQGYGRLIRSIMDYGYFCILDGGDNKNTLREIERDLCGPELINTNMEKIIKEIQDDYYKWSIDNFKKLINESKVFNKEDFNNLAVKNKVFWEVVKDNDTDILFRNKNKLIKYAKKPIK